MTTYVWAWDDGPPGAELDPLDEEVGVPIASLDCSKLIVYDGQQGWTWLDTDLAHREVPREGQRGQWRAGSGEWRVRSGHGRGGGGGLGGDAVAMPAWVGIGTA